MDIQPNKNSSAMVMVSFKVDPAVLHALRIKAAEKNLSGVSRLIRELIAKELGMEAA